MSGHTLCCSNSVDLSIQTHDSAKLHQLKSVQKQSVKLLFSSFFCRFYTVSFIYNKIIHLLSYLIFLKKNHMVQLVRVGPGGKKNRQYMASVWEWNTRPPHLSAVCFLFFLFVPSLVTDAFYSSKEVPAHVHTCPVREFWWHAHAKPKKVTCFALSCCKNHAL